MRKRESQHSQGESEVSGSVSRRDFIKWTATTGATVGLGAGLGGLVAACGGAEATTTTTTTAAATTTGSAPTTTTAAAGSTTTVTAAAQTGRQIKLGFVSEQTGMLASSAIADKWMMNRAQQAVKDGVLCGDGQVHPVSFVLQNSQSDSNRAAQVAGSLVSDDKCDMILVSGGVSVTPTVNQCEALGAPCLACGIPWQTFFFGGGATADKPYKWSYAHCFGLEQGVMSYIDAWLQLDTNKVVGLLWSNDVTGQAWADEKTGMPPALTAAGFTFVTPGLYQLGSDDYTQQISAFKKAGCEIQFGIASPGDLDNFWKQSLQQGYNPISMGCAKALQNDSDLVAMGPTSLGMIGSMGWSPEFPFKDSLTGATGAELAAQYEADMGTQWQLAIQQYSKFEWAIDVLKRTTNVDSSDSIVQSILGTNMTTITGPLNYTAPVKLGTDHPVLNNYRPQYGAAQWRKGTKYPYTPYLVANKGAPLVPTNSKIEPMVYA
jgi:branched-chain amino acid transport system substrate-binding protein